MARWRVLVSAPSFQSALDRYRSMLAARGVELIVPAVDERLDEAELLTLVGDIDGALCGDDRFTEKVLDAAPRLKVIAKWGTGIDSIDQEACRRRGVKVRNTPDAFTHPVADTVLGYVLCFARCLVEMNRGLHGGLWTKLPSRALRETTLGVIGVGNIGKAVIRRALGFGMRVVGNDIVAMPPEFLAETGILMVERGELLRTSDFVSINCDLNPTSYHLVDENGLALMQRHAVVINTARGSIVDEDALVAALQSGRIAGAALDVFEIEPLPLASPLRGMENVMLAPHNANNSAAAWEAVHESTVKALLAVLEGEDP